jgi:hypothetical protein
MAERLAGEIRSMNTAISDSRLDHRADVGAFEGTWSQLLAGMNGTMAAFAGLHPKKPRWGGWRRWWRRASLLRRSFSAIPAWKSLWAHA